MTNVNEIWSPIKSEERYFISSFGRLKNRHGKILKFGTDKDGYLYFSIRINGKSTSWRVHRIVATVFISNPENKPEVNHKNGIKTDNRIENLEWVTRSENQKHAFDSGLQPKPYGAKNSQHRKARNKITGEVYPYTKRISELYGLNYSTLKSSMRRNAHPIFEYLPD